MDVTHRSIKYTGTIMFKQQLKKIVEDEQNNFGQNRTCLSKNSICFYIRVLVTWIVPKPAKNRFKKRNTYENNRYHKDDPHYRTCEYCLDPVTEYGFCNACSQSCHDKLAERYRIQAQKKPCRQCGNDITRARNYKYCSDQCRYDAWRERMRKHPKNTNCRRCKNPITDKKQIVYCTAECRLKHIQEKYDEAHAEKKVREMQGRTGQYTSHVLHRRLPPSGRSRT